MVLSCGQCSPTYKEDDEIVVAKEAASNNDGVLGTRSGLRRDPRAGGVKANTRS